MWLNSTEKEVLLNLVSKVLRKEDPDNYQDFIAVGADKAIVELAAGGLAKGRKVLRSSSNGRSLTLKQRLLALFIGVRSAISMSNYSYVAELHKEIIDTLIKLGDFPAIEEMYLTALKEPVTSTMLGVPQREHMKKLIKKSKDKYLTKALSTVLSSGEEQYHKMLEHSGTIRTAHKELEVKCTIQRVTHSIASSIPYAIAGLFVGVLIWLAFGGIINAAG